LLAATAIGCGAEDPSSSDDDLTASALEAKVTSLVAASQERVFVNMQKKPSSSLTGALTAAAKRGVAVRAILSTAGGHDATWLIQQGLESNGVDVDVRSDNPAG